MLVGGHTLQASIPEDSTTAAEGDEAASPCSSSIASPSTNVLQDGCCATYIPSTAAGALSKRGRRSSVLRAAALPGHRLFSSSVQASRSLLLAKMSKARRKAYLAYTQQMAEYFAEVSEGRLQLTPLLRRHAAVFLYHVAPLAGAPQHSCSFALAEGTHIFTLGALSALSMLSPRAAVHRPAQLLHTGSCGFCLWFAGGPV